MKKDIEFPTVIGVQIAVTRQYALSGEAEWRVYLLNHNNFALENILVASTGYAAAPDTQSGESLRTSTLRHFFDHLSANSYEMVELIDPAVFHLCNEYWVSYYVNGKIYDKKFVFMPDTLVDSNLRSIEMLGQMGVLHG